MNKSCSTSTFIHCRIDHNHPTTIICYHANCMDGLMSADIAVRSIQSSNTNVYLLPISYGKPLPFKPEMHENASVMFVDFCPDIEVLKDLLLNHNLAKVSVFDHHISQAEKLTALTRDFRYMKTKTALEVFFDNESSGAGVVDTVLRSGSDDMAEHYETAGRYDLWKHKGDPTSNETYMASYFSGVQADTRGWYKEAESLEDYFDRIVALTEVTFKRLCAIAKPFTTLIKKGKELTDVAMHKAEELVKTANILNVDGYTVYTVPNCPGEHVNNVAAYIVKNDPQSIVVMCCGATTEEGLTKISLRAGHNTPYELHQVVGYFDENGGGHRNAAGGTFQGTVEGAMDRLMSALALQAV